MKWLAEFFTFISLYIPACVLLLPDVLSMLTEADHGSIYLLQQKKVESIIQCDVASISNTESYCWHLNSRLAVQWEGEVQNDFCSLCVRVCVCVYIYISYDTELLDVSSKRSSMYMHLYKHMGGYF